MDRIEDVLGRLAEAQLRTEENLDRLTGRVDQLAEGLHQLTVRVDQLAQRLDDLTVRVDRLAQRLDDLVVTVDHLAQRLDDVGMRVDQLTVAQTRTEAEIAKLTSEVGRLRGLSLEAEYRDKAVAYFQQLLRRIRLVSHEELETLASDAEDRGLVSAKEHADLLRVDVALRGQWRDGGDEAYLVAEVSSVVDVHDVERALARAALLGRIVPARVVAAVAGDRIIDDARRVAERSGIWQVLNGRAVSPDARPLE